MVPKNKPHSRSMRHVWITSLFVVVAIMIVAASGSSNNGGNLHHHHHHRALSSRSLAINPNLINYDAQQQQAGSTFSQSDLDKISQQAYSAPHTWTQCPKSYTGYRASYDCTAYIWCSNGRMKEEGYVKVFQLLTAHEMMMMMMCGCYHRSSY